VQNYDTLLILKNIPTRRAIFALQHFFLPLGYKHIATGQTIRDNWGPP